MAAVRMAIPTQRVLGALLEDVRAERYGLELADLAGLATGTVHPILARLEGVGWLESRWEDVDPRTEGRAARRYYRLTASGVEQARDALARAYRPPTRRSFSPRPAPRPGES
jgi:PadR family transcriptional regulator PadR